LCVLVFIIGPFLISSASAQTVTIPVNVTQPCFLNYTAGADLWQNCGVSEDYLDFALMGWQWVTGGYFSMIMVSLFIMVSYIKYHKAAYPIMIGVIFLPVAAVFFPDIFLTWALIFTAFTIAIFIWFAIVRQTKEYD